MQQSDFTSLIPPPNNLQPNFMAWMKANIQPYLDIVACTETFDTFFDLDTATGDQLDIIGSIIGVSRILTFQPGGGLDATLNNTLYRLAIRARIMKNQWKGTNQEIYDFWFKFFPQYPVMIQDTQSMTMNVIVINMPADLTGTIAFGYDTNTSLIKGYDQGYWLNTGGILQDMVTNGYFVPKPAGVKVYYQFITTDCFAYDDDSGYLRGYDLGEWISF